MCVEYASAFYIEDDIMVCQEQITVLQVIQPSNHKRQGAGGHDCADRRIIAS